MEGRRCVRCQATTNAVGREGQARRSIQARRQNEPHAQCKRIAASAKHFAAAGWFEDSGYRLFYFTTWAKARALQHWIDRSGITHRPMPKLGPWAAEIKEEKA
jgi:hypothetical protein